MVTKGGRMIRRRTVAAALTAVLALLVTACSTGTTDPATSVTTTGATLNATINPDGDNGRYRFEWRQASASTMNVTPWRSISNPGTAARQVSEQITGLSAGTRYAYRICGEETTGNRPTGQPDRLGYACAALREFTTAPLSPTGEQFPNRATTGVPNGWVPQSTRSNSLTVTTPGQVIQDIRFTGGASIWVRAQNVTIRRVQLEGGRLLTQGAACDPGAAPMVVEDSTFLPAPGQSFGTTDLPTIGDGNFIARRVEIVNRGEGYHSAVGCGTLPSSIRVEDSFTYINSGPWPDCPGDLHSDGYQSYRARGATFVNNTLVFGTLCGTSPYYAGYGYGQSSCAGQPRNTCPAESSFNSGVYNVDRMLVAGGGYTYRHQTPGYVRGLRIVNNGWRFGPIDNRCSVLSPWEAKIVNIDVAPGPNQTFPADAAYRVTSVVRDQPCNSEIVE
jgi:hypothetical protein